MNVDIVVVTFNSERELPGLFEALAGAAPVTVVDNNSEDGSADVAEAHGATVIRGEVNAGFGAGCNRGAAAGRADYVLFLNPDARITPEALRTMVTVLDRHPEIGIASPQLMVSEGRPQRVLWPYPSARDAWAEALGLRRLRPNRRAEYVVGACLLVRRRAFEEVHGFDERIWLYGEETELCRRLRDAGHLVAIVPEAEATHLGGRSGARVPDLVREHFVRGGEHFIARNEGKRALVSYRLATVVGSSVRGLLGVGGRSSVHRFRLRYAVRALATHPTTVDLDSPATRAPGRGLVVCSLEPWDEVWRRNQFFVRELLERDPDRRVLFVEPAFDVRHERRMRSGRRRQPGLRPVPEDGRITRVEPVKLLPRKLGPWSDRFRDRQVRRAAVRLGLVDPVLWVNDPSYASLAETMAWTSIYDITDDWTLSGDSSVARSAQRDEPRLFRRCERVVVCSEGLLSARRHARPDAVLVPNGVDVEEIRRPRPRPADLPAGRTAVYVGTISHTRTDLALVEALARELPDVTVVLVGPLLSHGIALDALRSLPNVRLLGPRPHRDVPGYLQHASAIIVPHLVNDFTERLDPIKLHECLALGRPTVATPVAGFRDAPAPVVVAEPSAFVQAVREVIASPPDDAPQAVASWADRAAAFDAVIHDAVGAPPRKRVRVVYVDHCARLSGAELALARLLPALRHVDPVVILGEHGPLEAVLRERGIPVEVLALDEDVANTNRGTVTPGGVGVRKLLATARDVWALRRRLRELQPDIVHTNTLKAALLGGVAGRLAGRPVVWHLRDRVAADYLPRPAVRLVRLASWVLPSAIIANSRATLSTLGEHRKADVVGSTVAHDLVDAAHLGRDRPRAAALHVAMVGRLSAWKGQDVFLRAFAEAFPDGTETAVLVGSAMFGEDDFAASLPELIDQLGLGGRVELPGFVDDVPAVLARSDVLVHASVIAEPFGQVVVEGMAAGLPVITTDIGGPAEVVTDGVDGLLCRPGDPHDLARALRALAADPGLRERLGRAGQARARDFRPEAIAPRIEAVYARLERPRPR